jgi:hypothetical protein
MKAIMSNPKNGLKLQARHGPSVLPKLLEVLFVFDEPT